MRSHFLILVLLSHCSQLASADAVNLQSNSTLSTAVASARPSNEPNVTVPTVGPKPETPVAKSAQSEPTFEVPTVPAWSGADKSPGTAEKGPPRSSEPSAPTLRPSEIAPPPSPDSRPNVPPQAPSDLELDADPQSAVLQKWDCSALDPDSLDENANAFVCSDNETLVIHADMLQLPRAKLGLTHDSEWVQLRFGSMDEVSTVTKPMTSCVSSENGAGAVKSLMQQESIKVGATAGISFGVFGSQWLRSSMIFNSGLTATLDRSVEYGCDSPAGEKVQLLAAATEYKLSGWHVREIEVRRRELRFSDWHSVPDFQVTDTVEKVACVVDHTLLTCDNFWDGPQKGMNGTGLF